MSDVRPFPPASVPGSTAPALTWPLLIAALAIAGIVVMALFAAPWQKTAGDRIDYAARLEREFDASGIGTSVRAEGESLTTLAIDADADDATKLRIAAIRNDTETRRTLKSLGFRRVVVTLDSETVEIDLTR